MNPARRIIPKAPRLIEATALTMIAVIVVLGFLSVAAATQLRLGNNPASALPAALGPSVLIIILLVGFHIFLRSLRMRSEQIIWPTVSLLFVIGAKMIWRLRGAEIV